MHAHRSVYLHPYGIVFVIALTAVACSHQGAPTGPTSPTATTGGALVTGSVVASGVSLSSVQVSVSGTSTTTMLDSANHFAVSVPDGNVELRFTGPGVNASVSVPEVENNEKIDLDVTLGPGSAEIEGLDRGIGSELQLEGRVEALPPAVAAGTFTVRGRLVTTDGSTSFVLGGQPKTFADLAIGDRVHVKGAPNGTGILARLVDIQNTQTTLPVEINGIVSGFSGSQTGFQFTVNGRLIKGDAQTQIKGAFADLKDGARVEVKGAERNGFVYATEIHVNKSHTD